MYRQHTIGQDTRRALLAALLALGVGAPAWALPPDVVSPIGTYEKDEDDGSATIGLDSVFKDPEDDAMVFSIVANDNPAIVALAIVGGKDLQMTFLPNQNGEAKITVRATAADGATDHTFTLKLSPKNDSPVVVGPNPLPITVAEDSGSHSISLAAQVNDVDLLIEGDVLTWAVDSRTNPALYAAGPAMSGSNLTFSLAPNQSGASTIRIEVRDQAGDNVSFNVALTVTPQNDAPVVVLAPAAVIRPEDNPPFSIPLAGVFSDPDGDVLVLSITGWSNASLFAVDPVISGTNLDISLAPNAHGSSTITIRAQDPGGLFVNTSVNLTITPVNDPPVATAPAPSLTVAEDSGGHSVSLAAAFTDADGDTLSYAVTGVSNAALFSAAPTVAGAAVNFTLAANANGNSTITVEADDGNGGTANTTVTVNVTPVNDPPTVASPMADRTVAEDSPAIVIDLASVFADIDAGDVLTYVATSSDTAVATVAVSGSTLTVTLVPDASGVTTIAVVATDSGAASVSDNFILTVNAVDDAPVASDDVVTMNEDAGPILIPVLANDYLAEPPTIIVSAGVTHVIDGQSYPESSDSDPTPAFDGVGTYVTLPNGTVRIDGNAIEYTPREHFSGTDYFTYTIQDADGQTSTATVTITIIPVNDAPRARTGTITYTIVQGQVLSIVAAGGLVDKAWDPDGDPISVIQETAPDSIGGGFPGTTLTLLPNGAFVYTPDVGFVGTDRFEIRYYDGTLPSELIEVFVQVTAAPPPPAPPPPGEVEYDFNLANVPLEDAIGAEANVLVIMDDSGSMDWSIMTNGVQGEFWISNTGVKANNVSASTRSYRYVFPAPTNVYGNNDVVPTEAALAAAGTDFTGNNYGVWRARNHQYNTIYYNPAVQYLPWVGLDRNNVEFGNVDPTAAPYDPYDVITNPATQLVNLLTPITYNSANVPKTRNGGSTRTVTNSNVYIPSYYTTTVTGVPAWNAPRTLVEIRNDGTIYPGGPMRDDCATDDGDPTTCTFAQEIQNFANWFSYYRNREYTAKAALGRAVSEATNIRLGYVVLNNANERTRIDSLNASFRIGHKRAMMHQIYKITSNDGTPLRTALDRAGRHFECVAGDSFGSTSSSSPGSANCPVLPAPEGQCQNNFALLFSDGTWNDNFSLRGNTDGDGNTVYDGPLFRDTVQRTLADVAMHYYERDLHPSLLNGVPTTEFDRLGAPATAFGNQGKTMHQHMKTYTVGIGLTGNINPATVPRRFTDTFNWGNAFNDGPEKVDDMVHAAVNGRGQSFSATEPVLLSRALREAFAAFTEGSVSVSAVAFNSTALREETVEYRGFFNLRFNTGDLRALRVNPSDGTVDNANPIWRAAQTVAAVAPTNRVIFTYDRNADQGRPFRFANLNADQQAQLTLQEVNYIRGDRSNEEPSGLFRARPTVEGILGDIVHSAPQYVGGPRAIRRDQTPFPTLPGKLYSAFKAAQAGRKQVVYVGANDGMVHGFDAANGAEIMGFVPNKLIDSTERFSNKVDLLASLSYSHRFFVDVTPSIEDVFIRPTKTSIEKDWTTVMVGALGGGGKGYYALNVTNPDSAFASEATASGTVLWEFTDRDDTYPLDLSGNPLGGAVNAVLDLAGQPVKDLGYSYSPAQIAMSNRNHGGTPAQKQWVTVFGNGYNSTAGIATLFVASIDGGVDGWSAGDVVKLTTGEGVKAPPDALAGLPNGLGVPALVDKDLNGTVDLIYAGDLFGYLYRFDVSDPDPANWKVTKVFQATYGSGASMKRQPITTQPFVRKHPSGTGFLVVFGTGSYVTEGDGVSRDIQSVYGVWDRLDLSPPTALANAKSTRLVEQTITNIVDETTFAFERLRYASNNAVNYTPDSGGVPGVYGWYFDLDMVRPALTVQGNTNTDVAGDAPPNPQFPGERAIRRFVPRGTALLITTVIPRDANTCFRSPPGSTFPIDPITGGTPQRPILDLNNDGRIDQNDLVMVGGVAYAAGILFDTNDLNGTLVDPSLLLGSGDADFLFLSGGDEQITLRIAGAEDPKTGRLSWRELEDAN